MSQQNTPSQTIESGQIIHGFVVERAVPIHELHATAYLFAHKKTGARLLHLFNDEPENLFSIAFRTPVDDHTGVPHILEHSVLCGSKKFPVKDPFQEMLKGSLQTFLNAMTYRDKTVYPVASQVEKDFFNLVDIYCDAVFHPLLTENTFYQEGWHFEVEDPAKPVGIKGIVYNEMKGVFSDFSSHVVRKAIAGLMPDTTYAFESGGDPDQIPALTYEGFTSFYRRYYHPSNALIFLYGNIASEKTLRFLNDNYLAEFEAASPVPAIAGQELWKAPRSFAMEAPSPKEDDGFATVLICWIFGDSIDPLSVLSGVVLNRYLLGTESSPLKRALIDSGLGQDIDDASGFDLEAVQSVFIAGLRKTRPEHAEKIQELVLATLRHEVEQGMNDDLLEGAIRQAEFHLREVENGHTPYHLRLAERCYNSWLYGGDPLAHLAFEKPLNDCKARKRSGDTWFREIIRKNLLDNNHRLLAVVVASSEKGNELAKQSEVQAAKLSASFLPVDMDRYRALTGELRRLQSDIPTAEALATLPRLTRSDLPPTGIEIPCSIDTVAGTLFYSHPIFTSDIVYLDIGFNLASLPAGIVSFLPLYLELLRRCGAAGLSYEQMATRVALATGGIGASTFCRTRIRTHDDLFFYSFVHGKSLRPRLREMLAILHDLLTSPDLSNRKQIQDLVLEERNNLNASLIGNGHQMAMLAASSRLAPSRYIEEALGGISQLRFLDGLARNGVVDIDRVIANLAQLHAFMINRNRCMVSVTADDPTSLAGEIAAFLETLPAHPVEQNFPQPGLAGTGAAQGIEISSAVNFTSRAWRLPDFDPAQYGLFFLLARHLSTGYLWDKVRVEGGAYGGIAVMSIAHPIFSCASYRDPNLAATLRHFEQGLRTIAAGVKEHALDQSVIGAIGRIDQPRSPHNRGFCETIDRLAGYSPVMRQAFREAVLGATQEKLSKAAEKIIAIRESAITVLGSAAAFDAAAAEGPQFERETLLNG